MKITQIIAAISITGLMSGVIYLINRGGNVNVQKTKIGGYIIPPVKNTTIPFQSYTIHPDSSIHIERPTGTSIHIPAKCFQRKDGSEPSGSVTITIREMHDASSIFLSGIPMEIIGSGGKHLQSAGMIEIRAHENQQELSLKTDKEIDISLASYKKGQDYDLYYLENNRQWSRKEGHAFKENERKKQKLEALSKAIATPDSGSTSDELIFVIDMDTSTNPELKPFVNQEWVLIEKEKEAETRKALRQSWTKAHIKPIKRRKMEYEITFGFDEETVKILGIDKTFSIIARPIMHKDQSRRKNRIEFEEKMKAYKIALQENEEERARIKQQADFVNQFKINQMGIWNMDKIMSEEVMITKVSFDFEKMLKGPHTEHNAYVIFEENNSVVYVNRSGWSKFALPTKRKKISIVAVLPDAQIAVVSSEEISNQIKKGSNNIFLSSKKMSANEWMAKSKSEGLMVFN
jgi:hypothetical protein